MSDEENVKDDYKHAVIQNCDVKEMDQSSIYPDGTPWDKRKWNFSIAMDVTRADEPSRVRGAAIISRVYDCELVAEQEMTKKLREILTS